MPVFAEQEIKFQPGYKKTSLLKALSIGQDYPVVYKPSRLVTGKDNKFIIKGEAGNSVSLAISDSNHGAPLFFGQTLRLGAQMQTQEAIIPDNGLLELNFKMPEDKKLEGKIYYFEVAVWKKSDFSDLKLAKILGSDNQETDSNGVQIILPVSNPNLPCFGPIIPGTSSSMTDTIDQIKSINNQDLYNYDMMNYYQTPVMLRNLNSLELNKNQNQK